MGIDAVFRRLGLSPGARFRPIADIGPAATSLDVNVLRLTYRPDDEWHGELFGCVESEGFKGKGSAWFGIGQLREFCALAGNFPISESDGPSLAGGFFDDGDHTLKQCHLAVRLSPHDPLGSIRVTVTLATPAWDSGDADLQRRVKTRFLVSYMDVERFRTSFEAMLDGQVEEAVLEATSS